MLQEGKASKCLFQLTMKSPSLQSPKEAKSLDQRAGLDLLKGEITKSFKIGPLLNPPSYAELGCALPAPTQKQRDFLKSHCLSKPAPSTDVYLSFTHLLLSQWERLLSRDHFPVNMQTCDQNCTWHIDALKQFQTFFSSFVVSAVLWYQNLCCRLPSTAREVWEDIALCVCQITLHLLPKKAALHWLFGGFPSRDLCLVSLSSPYIWNERWESDFLPSYCYVRDSTNAAA